jgi:integrase
LWKTEDKYPKNNAAVHAVTKECAKQHLHFLNSLQDAIRKDSTLQELPLATAILQHMANLSLESSARGAGWLPGTHSRYLNSLDGAFSQLGRYAINFQGKICLNRLPEWSSAKRSWDSLSRQFQPVHQSAATAEDIALAAALCKDREVAMFLILLWLLAARKGDVAHLRPSGVRVVQETGRIEVFVQEGKGVKARQGMYHIISHCPDIWKAELTEFINKARLANSKYLFRSSLTKSSEAISALRAANASLNLQAVRRGAAQALAKDKEVKEETIMKITGHRNPKTLQRYLDWDKTNEKAHSAAQEAARNNLAPRVALPAPPVLQL